MKKYALQAMVSILACGWGAEALAAGPWTFKLTPQVVYGAYTGSPTRDRMAGVGLFLDGQHSHRGGFVLGFNHGEYLFKPGNPDIRQNEVFTSGRFSFSPAGLPGKLTARIDYQYLDNDDPTRATDGVHVVAPQLSFLSADKTWYLDLGYARSDYADSTLLAGGLTVHQWTPTVGFGLNQGFDWVQLRAYVIDSSNPARSQNKDATGALEVKWFHYFTRGGWTPERIQLGALAGNRIYAVDGDAAVVYNLADLQKGSVSLNVQWGLGKSTSLMIGGSYERFGAVAGSAEASYGGVFAFAALIHRW